MTSFLFPATQPRADPLTRSPAHPLTRTRVHSLIAHRSLLIVLLFLVACGNNGSEEGDDYGDLLSSPGGLLVLEEEHPTGFGRPDCFACHEIRNMHVVNRTSLPDCDDVEDPGSEPCIDLAEIQSFIRQEKGASCFVCHGSNGVGP
jgi:hypothetical protein